VLLSAGGQRSRTSGGGGRQGAHEEGGLHGWACSGLLQLLMQSGEAEGREAEEGEKKRKRRKEAVKCLFMFCRGEKPVPKK